MTMLTTRKYSFSDSSSPQLSEIIFDVEAIAIQARYADELSAHRAKRVWIETLESHFLLDCESDYLIAVNIDNSGEDLAFILRCHFLSACARYAFWRITNDQAPEAQYVLETAHIPLSEDSWLGFQTSDDLRELANESSDNPLSIDHASKSVNLNKKWFDSFESMIDKIVRSFDPNDK
ncbi:MAG: hypothetical protein KDD70_00110 [Bdellovibrionales bacterium]|nr:hypothetical protein [Bdellovibrionales bacterium]